MALDEETLLEIFGVPAIGIVSIKSENGFANFFKPFGVKDLNNMTLNGEFLLLLELVKGALLPWSGKEINPIGLICYCWGCCYVNRD